MTKKLLFLAIIIINVIPKLNAQVSIFTEDFETATGAENIASPYLGWQNGFFDTNPITDNNFFWVFDATRCQVIDVVETPADIPSNYSMAVSTDPPSTAGILPEYQTNRRARTLVYYTTPIDATNHNNLTLDFNWICEGEAGQDYGYVLYSFDATNWIALPGTYEGQSTVQSVTNLDLSVLDGQTFYLGFGWDNDNNGGTFPGFILDDIDIKGTILSTCTAPNQPTGLILTPTGDTVNGSFNAGVPAPSNYLVVISPSASVAPTPVNGAAYNIGDTLGTGTVVDIDSDTLFTATGLIPSSTYDIYIYSFDTGCLNGPIYNPTNPLSGNVSTTSTLYCTPSTAVPSSVYIDNVEFLGTLNDVSNLTSGFSTSPSGYQDFTELPKSIQQQGEGINVYVDGVFSGLAPRFKAWVDWDKDGAFGNTALELVYDSDPYGILSTTFGFVIPANQPIGDYRIRIRIHSTDGGNSTYNFNPCEAFAGNGRNRRLGEAEDYLFTVVQSCSARITSFTDGSTCGPGSANISVAGNATASGFNWYTNETGGAPIATSSTFSPVISATTTYWATATDGSCESLKRIPVTAIFKPVTELTITTATPIICGGNDIIEIEAIGSTEIAYLIDEDFESGGLGVFTNTNVLNQIVGGSVNGANIDNLIQWLNRTSTYVPENAVWLPAISSGFGANRFVMSTSDVAPPGNAVWESLQSPILDASTFTDLTLSFDIYFSKYIDSPTTATTQDEVLIYDITGGTRTLITSYTVDMGNGTSFVNVTIPMTAYINPNLRFSIDYSTNVDENSNPLSTSGSFGWNDGVAIDNVKLFGSRPLNPSFTWTGTVDAYTDAAATIPYVDGTPAASVFIKPTIAQLSLNNFTFTANATLSNGCTINKDITITNNTKIWNGSMSSDWNTPANWSPSGVPTSDDCVIIDNIGPGTDSFINGPPLPPVPAFAKNVTIKNDAIIELEAQTSLTITDGLNVEPTGLFYMKNNSSLIQVNNVANTGNIFKERAPANGGAIDNLNYVYWSSPVKTFNVANISPGSGAGSKWKWTASTGSIYGNWMDASSDPMTDGQGYIVRGLSGVVPNPSVALTANSALFSGEPNNGDITRAIEHGGYNGGNYPGFNGVNATNDDDNWNLIGNPYPSALWADSFLERNAASSIPNDDYNNFGLPPNQKIIGTLWLWPHAGIPDIVSLDPFYDDFGSNYDSNQYIAYNFMGSTTGTFQGYIASGQAFFVLADHFNAAPSGDDVLFHNGMRNATFGNSNFFKSADSNEKRHLNHHRIWLNLVDSQNKAQAILVGYAENATNERDNLYDGPQFTGSLFSFYSLIDNDRFAIQGRTLPFTNEDTIPLGLVIPQNDIYKIAINQVDGLFENETQDIYLEDTHTNTIHNLRIAPYSFTSEAGTFNDRFILRYTNSSLSVEDFDSLSALSVFEENDIIVVKSGYEAIESIEVYDLLGRTLYNNPSINSKRFKLSSINPNDTALFLKIKLNNGQQKIVKLIF